MYMHIFTCLHIYTQVQMQVVIQITEILENLFSSDNVDVYVHTYTYIYIPKYGYSW